MQSVATPLALEARGLTKRFGGVVAVDHVDYRLRWHEFAGIIGPNGAGKTTFFNLLTGRFFPTDGQIWYDGDTITSVPAHLRVDRGIVRTFQIAAVFDSLSVYRNVALALVRFNRGFHSKRAFIMGDIDDPRIVEKGLTALQMVGLHDRARLPASALPYGDKRKLEIAMALALDPKLLLLDEPFAGLSDSEIVEVSRLLFSFRTRLTAVIIEHKISRLTELVDRLSVMHEGRIIGDGTPEQVLNHPEVRRIYWGQGS